MGKKVKPCSLLDETSQEKVEQESTVFEDTSLVGNGQLTVESREKLEKYDALEKTVASLSKEKEELEAKVAEYAERLAELQTAANQISDLNKEIEKLKKDNASSSKAAKEITALKKDIKDLREEADGYLVKISELTFENANLTCQLDELAKREKMAGKAPNQRKYAPNSNIDGPGQLRPPNKDAYNPYSNNGYGTWN